MRATLSLALFAGSLAHTAAAANWTVGQVVNTSSGPVSGHPASIETEVSEYLGIPFAVPPVGDLRWTAPQRYNGTSPINGTKFSPSCPAQKQASSNPSAAELAAANLTAAGLEVLIALGQIGDNFSEDCLTVNVWTKPQTGEAKKAVLLWVYGGGFSTGNSDSAVYNGQYIAEQEDVVLVSFNYRLDVFGFPGASGLTQNLGLLDQRMAVEWVRDNIAAFGGDPSRITLFGQSAGSASVDYYTYAWVEDPIAHAFIEESGSVFGPAGGLGAVTAQAGQDYWGNLTVAVNCSSAGNTDSSATLACMKGKSVAEILDGIVLSSPPAASAVGTTFSPTVDEKVVFGNYTARSLAGEIAARPLLVGNANDEGQLFRVLDVLRNVSNPASYYDAFTKNVFTCPASGRANISLAKGNPTWRYRWFGAFPNTELSSVPYSGAWHASELPVLFGNPPQGGNIPNNTAEELAIMTYIRGAWSTFAKNPTTGLTSYGGGWPKYVPGGQTLVQLAYNNMTGTNLVQGTKFDAGCQAIFAAPASNGTSGSSNSSSPSSTATGTSPSSSVSPSGSSGSAPSSSPVPAGAGPSMVMSLSMVMLAFLAVVSQLVM